MSDEQLKYSGNTIEIGRDGFSFTQETQQLLKPAYIVPAKRNSQI